MVKFNASYFIGGRLCVDFCNTFDHLHLPPQHDFFTDYATILEWGKAAGIISGHPDAVPASSRREIADLLAVRSLIYRMLLPFASGETPAAADVAAFNARAEGLRFAAPRPGKGRYALVGSSEGPLQRIRLQPCVPPPSLLVSGHPEQLRLCGECGWMFYDTSRNHLRRWCTMKICGNRAKARRHY